jgi:hypothetical protein
MVFRTYSLYEHGIPTSDVKFSDKDTYIAVVSTYKVTLGQDKQSPGLKAIKELFNVLYEGPDAFNHFHSERNVPSQKIIIFEKKPACPPEQKSALDVLPKAKTPGETIL